MVKLPALFALLTALAAPISAQSTARVTVNTAGLESDGESYWPAISADGRYVAFKSFASNFAVHEPFAVDVYVHDRMTGSTTLVSVGSSGAHGNDSSIEPALSADGNVVAFMSGSSNLVPNDTNGFYDVFVRDLATAMTTRVSVSSSGAQANQQASNPVLSSDGRYVAFHSRATNLVAGDTNLDFDCFVHDRVTGVTERVSLAHDGSEANLDSLQPCISDDGRYYAFESSATNLVPNDFNSWFDVYVRDRVAGTTVRASSDSQGVGGNQQSSHPRLSADGRWVAFTSGASNLVPGDTNGKADVYVRDLWNGQTQRASLAWDGTQAPLDCYVLAFSGDGRVVAFDSSAALTPNAPSNGHEVYLRDLVSGTTTLGSLRTDGGLGNNWSGLLGERAALSFDGTVLVFTSASTNLVPGDTNASTDLFVRDHGLTAPVDSYCTAKVNSLGCTPVIGASGLPTVSGYDGLHITAVQVLNQKPGTFFWGTAPLAVPFLGGTLCVHAPFVRSAVLYSGGGSSGASCSGAYSFAFTQAHASAHGLGAGSTVYGQFWSRDNGFPPPNNSGLTDAVRFTIAP